MNVQIANPNLHPDLIVYAPAQTSFVPGTVLASQQHELRLGAGAYTGSMLAALGHTVRYLDVVGDDLFGRFTIDELARLGYATDTIRRYHGDHMVVVSIADEYSQGASMISSCPNDWQRSFQELFDLATSAGSTQLLYVWSWYWSYSNRNVLNMPTSTILESVRSRSELVFLDPNWKPAGKPPEHETEELRRSLKYVDVLKLNARDSALLVGAQAPAEALARLLDLGPSLVVLTVGANGCFAKARRDSELYSFPAGDVVPRDTTGAGDYFGAALADGVLRGRGLSEAVAAAVAAAGLAIQREQGARLPTVDEIERLAAKVLQKRRQP